MFKEVWSKYIVVGAEDKKECVFLMKTLIETIFTPGGNNILGGPRTQEMWKWDR